jgi:hypothetical protein
MEIRRRNEAETAVRLKITVMVIVDDAVACSFFKVEASPLLHSLCRNLDWLIRLALVPVTLGDLTEAGVYLQIDETLSILALKLDNTGSANSNSSRYVHST